MRCSRYEALAGGGGRELLNSAAITEAIRPCNPQGEFGARHWPTRSTYARHRIQTRDTTHGGACREAFLDRLSQTAVYDTR